MKQWVSNRVRETYLWLRKKLRGVLRMECTAGILGVLQTIITGAVAIGVAKITVNQYREKTESEEREAKKEKQESLRHEGVLLQMKMTDASLNLGLITAKTVQNKKTNGDVEEAIDKAEEIRDKLNDFLQRASQSI